MFDIESTFADLVLRVVEDEGDGRTIEGMICPWGVATPVVKPIAGLELYHRGAFDKSLREATRPIPLLTRHAEDEPAAVLTTHDNRDDGQHATFRALRTRSGDDALELIREGLYLGLSVGGWAVPARTTIRRGVGGRQMIERYELRLDHVGLVRTPAFADAQVLALRTAGPFVPWDAAAAAWARRRRRERWVLANAADEARVMADRLVP